MSTNSRGVAILFNTDVEYTVHNKYTDATGNLVVIDLEIYQRRITLSAIYGPNRDTPEFYTEIKNVIDTFENSSVILVGDWNMVLNQTLDTQNYRGEYNRRAKNVVKQFMNDFQLHDTWREDNPSKNRYTWKQRNPTKISRLDFFPISKDMQTLKIKSDISSGYRTDHSMITLELNLNNSNTRGKGFFKLNTSILKDIAYINIIKKCIRENIERYVKANQCSENIMNIEFEISDQLFWDTLKMEIRRESMQYSAKKNEIN